MFNYNKKKKSQDYTIMYDIINNKLNNIDMYNIISIHCDII